MTELIEEDENRFISQLLERTYRKDKDNKDEKDEKEDGNLDDTSQQSIMATTGITAKTRMSPITQMTHGKLVPIE